MTDLDKVRFNLKVFLIKKDHYLIKGKSADEVINVIKDNHRSSLMAKDEKIEIVNATLETLEEEEFTFYSYCYNQPKSQNYWKLFLPDELVRSQNFEITEFSYVLFTKYKSAIYCTVGGSGYSVIKSFIDNNFGIDFYQHFAKPAEDILIGVSSRGVASNIPQRSNIYNFDQRISESLEYSEIPKKLKIIIRQELKDGIFSKYKLTSNRAIMEVGAFFSIKKKLDFSQFKELLKDITQIKSDKSEYVNLTLFEKIEDEVLEQDLQNELLETIAKDIALHNTPDKLGQLHKDIIEVINSRQGLEAFFECDSFTIRFKHASREKDLRIYDREQLYISATRYIYNSLKSLTDRSEIRDKIFKLNIVGSKGSKELTFGTFYSHITSELTLRGKKYFRVDESWYHLNDQFLEMILTDAIDTYTRYKFDRNILNRWKVGEDEDKYNKSHTSQDYLVLDKLRPDNIEPCDILHLSDDRITFIHVKNSFNTQMRNLYIQVILATKRLVNDLYNKVGSQYLKQSIDSYNKNNGTSFDSEDWRKKILNNNLRVEIVMAYNNTAYPGKTAIEKIRSSESNIAKYSLVQTAREMRQFRNFSFKVIDIATL